MRASAAELPPPGTLLANQYRLLEVVGEGGMGVIYRARQESVGRDVAIKILRARFAHQEDLVRRFENEARIISQLRHPNTIRLYDVQRTEGGSLFIVTEFLTGRSLLRLLREGPLPLERIVHITDQMCGSLSEAHEAGIVHRDLKPENVFLDHVGGEDHVKVLDFGIAKLLQGEATQTQPNVIMGTPAYMSPEQASGEPADARSDLYSLGILLYQMLTGRPPFMAESPVALLLKQIRDPPPPLTEAIARDIPADLQALVYQLLEKLPEDRPASVDEVRARLRQLDLRAWSEADVPAHLPGPEPRAHRTPPRIAAPAHFDELADPSGHISLANEMPEGRTDFRLAVGGRFPWAKWGAVLGGAALGLFALVWLIASPQARPTVEPAATPPPQPAAVRDPQLRAEKEITPVPPAAVEAPKDDASLAASSSAAGVGVDASASPDAEGAKPRTQSLHVGSRGGRRAGLSEADPLGASIAKLEGAQTATAAAKASSPGEKAKPVKAQREDEDESIEDRPLDVDIE